MPLQDWSGYIPVVCETDSKYAGKCYMEPISSVRTVNGKDVKKDVQKSDFQTGDVVTLRYKTKDYQGTVNFAEDKELDIRQRDTSDSPPSVGGGKKLTDNPGGAVGDPAEASPRSRSRASRPKKRSRSRSLDGHGQKTQRVSPPKREQTQRVTPPKRSPKKTSTAGGKRPRTPST